MNNPMLVAALAADRRYQYPCGAVTQRPSSLCRRQCRGAATWRRETARMSCWTNPGLTRGRTARTRFLVWMASLLQGISKEAGN
jgi:hypothetical protein